MTLTRYRPTGIEAEKQIIKKRERDIIEIDKSRLSCIIEIRQITWFFPLSTYLTRRDPDRNMARFYAVSVEPNLFGYFVAARQWGRIGTDGRISEDWFENRTAAADAAAEIIKRKQRRGYLAC